MATKKSSGKPKPATLKSAEKELHDRKTSNLAKTPAGYVVKSAKGVKENKKKKN